MSDRLPPRRRSGGGRHVATAPALPAPRSRQRGAHRAACQDHRSRTRRPLAARLAQGGVVVALAAAVAAVLVNPATGDDASSAPAGLWAGAISDTRSVTATRTQVTQVADVVTARAQAVRADGAQANVPADQLARLDALRTQVSTLVSKVQAESVVVRKDRASVASRGGSSDSRPPAPDPTSTVSLPADTAAAIPVPTPSSGPTVDTPEQIAAAIPPVLASDDPDAAQLRDAVIALACSTEAVSAAVDANRTAAKADEDAAAQQAAAAADAAAAQAAADAQRAAWKTSLQGYPNGRIPASALCAPTFDGAALLRCDAAEALDNLDAAYLQAFGTHLTVNDSYRSYAAQVACLSTRGWLCATPGTSNHGLGIAVDLGGGVEQAFSAQHRWMVTNAAAYGFVHPAWAEPGGSKPEPWHWEYTG